MQRATPWILLGLLAVGCKKDEPATQAPAPDASEAGPVDGLDPDLAEAVAAASSAAQPAKTEGGPPPQGIFGAGEADREIKSGDPFKVTVGSEGTAPRVLLSPVRPEPGSKTKATFQVASQAILRGAPIQLDLVFEAGKLAGEGGTLVPVSARVLGARVPLNGAPEEIVGAVTRLKGSELGYVVAPDGAGRDFVVKPAKGVRPDIEGALGVLGDSMALFSLPYPDKPLGVGGFWMVTSRQGVFGLDLVTYRLVTVESIEPGRTALKVNTKRYAASNQLELRGMSLEAGREMLEFQAMGEATLELRPGAPFPSVSRDSSQLSAALGSSSTTGRPKGLELRTRVELVLEGATPPAPQE